ncbi:pyridoxal kinase [Phanerochaete sordida]|uniref:pyridoxal kinase n=1 Tax=Phanerochaete sordida TaxID=48140 RepID=A0A9P3GHP1_9APHY|nr:pyridoxal kinase [Phanerochaete sordida]
MSKGRILSIQSHVAFGYVGGKAAVFPLQCLGYDVDVVNTVNFSNHTGYGRFGGSRATAAELTAVLENMEKNRLLQPERLLTGYIPGSEALSVVLGLAQKLREKNPELIYLLDPVLGDSGKLYVSPDVIPIYRAMLPLSTIITPNWFEVETLTDVQITDVSSLRRALKILHEQYQVPNVVVSSIPLRPWLHAALPAQARPSGSEPDASYLLCIASSATDTTKGPAPSAVHIRAVTCLSGYFSGVGDLFSALVLAHFRAGPHAGMAGGSHLAHAAAQALAKTHAMLKLTDEYAAALPEEDRLPTDEELDAREPERKVRRMNGRELRLVQGQDIIRSSALADAKMSSWEGFWEE